MDGWKSGWVGGQMNVGWVDGELVSRWMGRWRG